VAERLFGPYRLVRQIAVGGMAEIHLAKATGIAGFEKYVALKMIHPNFAEDEQFIQMLVDEAKIAVQLTHGNIAQTFDLGRVGDTFYITMEYVDGADLYKILRRASEQDVAMPLDVCAFVGKEISSALDHAHRKRDHTGKSLGIVHRDVSPQNVLVSFSGEVKLVDFGIAKAAMKVRQTAVGVIKGKYYYMSPEQAWGDPIDHRSDIFSAGIVLYEMITGQMLYLEEDLHKLLEMARAADIAPPSKLRRGVPPQLERIVMHALERVPGERYQNAGDLATDLERFLHAYSPVFTASKLSTLLRQVVGDPTQVPDDPAFESIEFRDGVMSTHPLDDAEVAHATDRAQVRDENSVIFRVSELEKPRSPEARVSGTPRPGTPRPGTPRPGTPRPGTSRPTPPPVPGSAQTPSSGVPMMPASSGASPPPRPGTVRPTAPRVSVPRITRPADPMPLPPRQTGRLPSITAPRPPTAPLRPSGGGQVMKAREAHEDTRRLESPAPTDPLHDESSELLLPPDSKQGWDPHDRTTSAGEDDDEDLDTLSGGERTVITGAPMGFMFDLAGDGGGDEPVEVTLVTAAPTGPFGDDDDATVERSDDGPTLSRDANRDSVVTSKEPAIARSNKTPAPAALAARIHAPAVSELRKPRPSRRTPSTGAPTGPSNVLQAIVTSQASEPMPAPRPMPPPRPTPPTAPVGMSGRSLSSALPPSLAPQAPPNAQTLPAEQFASQFSLGTPGGEELYSHDASGLPMAVPTPPGMPPSPVPGVPPHLQPYLHMQGAPPGYPPYGSHEPPPYASHGSPPMQPHGAPMSPHGYPQLSPGALYQFQPTPQEMSLTGQMRLLEIDELPPQYRLDATRRRWFTYIVSGALAVTVAAAVTFLIIRSIRETTQRFATLHIQSVPAGADVRFDGTLLAHKTPLPIPEITVGSTHTIQIEYDGYAPYSEDVTMPKDGSDVSRDIALVAVKGRIVVNTRPPNAEIWINDQLDARRSPTTIPDLDIATISKVELRLKGFPSLIKEKKDLVWTAGKLTIDYAFVR
jgi:serine/threonine protein kinase